jgi:hypothetical protein
MKIVMIGIDLGKNLAVWRASMRAERLCCGDA